MSDLILAGLITFVAAGIVYPENRVDLRPDSNCAVGAQETESMLSLTDWISRLWEAGEVAKLARVGSEGSLSTPNRLKIEGLSELEAAISEPLNRAIFNGSRLEIVLRCLRQEESKPNAIGVEGTWRISRFYGQESAAGGNPLPSHLMPPTAGGFVAEVIQRDGEWSLRDLSLIFDSPN